MTIELILITSVTTALSLFLFLRVVRLEFHVSKLNSMVEYLMTRRGDDH
jgi:hypothetical protein